MVSSSYTAPVGKGYLDPMSGQPVPDQNEVSGVGASGFFKMAAAGLIKHGDTITVHEGEVNSDYRVMVVGQRHDRTPKYMLDSSRSKFNMGVGDVLRPNTPWEVLRKVKR